MRYPEWAAFMEVLQEHLDDLKDVTHIDETSATDPGIQALAMKHAHKGLTDFLHELGVLSDTEIKQDASNIEKYR